MNRSAVGGVALLGALLAPAAFAQDRLSTKMSASIAQVYDGNLFAAPQPEADLISRAGTSLEMGFRSLPVDIVGRYEIQAERYLDHPELNAPASHQDAHLMIRYSPRPRLGIVMDGGYLRTQTPADLNFGSGLAVGRGAAERVALGTTVRYQLQPLTIVSGEYSFGNDAIAGGVSSTAQRWRAGLQQRMGPRDTYRFDYQLRHTAFGGGAASRSHTITAGWDRALSPRNGIEIAAGPRFTGDGAIRPEISAILRRQLSRGELSINYSSTELTAIGESGTIDVHRAAFTARYRPLRRLEVSVSPVFIRSTRSGAAVPVYALDAESIIGVSRRIAFSVWARAGRQDGTLSDPRAVIPYRGAGLKLQVAALDSPVFNR